MSNYAPLWDILEEARGEFFPERRRAFAQASTWISCPVTEVQSKSKGECRYDDALKSAQTKCPDARQLIRWQFTPSFIAKERCLISR